MNSALTDQLSQAVAQTVEALTFVFATPEPWEPPVLSGVEISVEVAFEGHFEGDLVFVCPSSAAREMTLNMLGLEEGDAAAEAQIHDALKELVNILCGNILPTLAGAEAVFNLSAPNILAPGSDPNRQRSTADTLSRSRIA